MAPTNDVFGREGKAVRQILGDYPLIEATADMLIFVTADDAKNAVRGDPNNCSFANACKRSYGSHGVVIYPTVAYIDMPDETGKHVVFRFRVKEGTREAIERLDLEGERREGTFRLYAVPKREQLAVVRRNKAKRQKALMAGRSKVNPARVAAAKKNMADRKLAKLYGLRDGTLAVQV